MSRIDDDSRAFTICQCPPSTYKYERLKSGSITVRCSCGNMFVLSDTKWERTKTTGGSN